MHSRDVFTRLTHEPHTASVQTHILRVQKTVSLFPFAYYVRGTGCLSFGNLPMTSTCLNKQTNIMQPEEQPTSEEQLLIDGYLMFLSESTDFNERAVAHRPQPRKYAKSLRKALRKEGVKHKGFFQVWGSNSGFYVFSFEKTADKAVVLVSTQEWHLPN